MDTQKLIADMKARFAHNSAKHYLKEKYTIKLQVADQGGLWKADHNTIGFLNSVREDTVIMLDHYENLCTVDVKKLLTKLTKTYNEVMQQWHDEFKELENKR